MATTLKRIETLRLNGDSDGARRLAEWKAWRCEAYDINGMVTGSALNLYKDRTRGLKYILLKLVEHVPNAKRPRDQFRVLSCGVFKIADIYPEIEAILALNPGEGPEFIAETLKEAQGDRNPAVAIAFLDLTWGENIEAWLGCSMSSSLFFCHFTYCIHQVPCTISHSAFIHTIRSGARP
jgi:hypothetical protein